MAAERGAGAWISLAPAALCVVIAVHPFLPSEGARVVRNPDRELGPLGRGGPEARGRSNDLINVVERPQEHSSAILACRLLEPVRETSRRHEEHRRVRL